MYMGKQKTPLSVLEKKVPRNAKYSKVKGYLDTGNAKVKLISTKEFLKRQNELFVRIRARDLADKLELDNESKTTEPNSPEQQQKDISLLLLDLRDLDDYKKCHIRTAVSYPIININQQRFSSDMYRMKGKKDKLIVVYDEDEAIASVGATQLVERGFENVRLLSGGLKVFGNALGHLLNGELPEHLVKKEVVSPTESRATRREARRRRSSGGADTSPRSYYAASVSGFTGCSVSSTVSHKSTFSRAPRWVDDRSSAQQHKEIVSKLHHTSLYSKK